MAACTSRDASKQYARRSNEMRAGATGRTTKAHAIVNMDSAAQYWIEDVELCNNLTAHMVQLAAILIFFMLMFEQYWYIVSSDAEGY